MKKLFCLALFCLSALCPAAFASSSDVEKAPEIKKEVTYLQFPPLWIPTYSKKNTFRKMLVFTSGIDIEPEHYQTICVNMPFLADSLVTYINNHPLPKSGFNDEAVQKLAESFLAEALKKLQLKGVKGIKTFRGDIKQNDRDKLISYSCTNMKITK